ncbi:hypothetical protein GLOIN_2v1535111 [Rhizophagus irregularis DAOM 181602=DAOM 197198]|nr:hypothetical protein GLOIN_2v1535111 [Rhizophagus irregularis DAOM 181602=DAOM 197198]POG78802.1 hypothetical protein GLOIN_2v1535111 [Rhizophagus irregularis DAOM 181602=DAOM 197198]|eukprot:XP_025185668.1 hypothetical protein GLOIN_2v1535111 [Rhizophagus irregularis DAOM 181602=DAOM 197198]
MVPNNRQNIITQPYRKSHSIIINSQHFAIFASWIEKKNSSYYNEKNIPYKFNLLYRASRDGNTDAEFHKKCDNKGPTIVIARFTDSEQIVGGYNPLDWKPVYSYNGYYKSTKDSFIFLFTNKSNLQTAKASYPIDENQIYSIWCNPCCGPTFGSGNDLLCSNGNWSSNQFTYHKIHFPSNFNINDYEVFQIKK